MLNSVKVVNFQSLHDVEIEFGDFTVIVGPSSSGKSALTRAIKAVASNSLDSDYITRGAKRSAVSLRTEDTTVTIERESGDTSVYKIAQSGSKESRYSKLNRQVPAEVTAALGIAASTKEVESINFAGQFDTPYLLREGASSVARVLGELTNVSTIFAAVKEASKRAKNASTLLNLRKKDQEVLLADLTKYSDVTQTSRNISQAEIIMQDCKDLERQVAQLAELVATTEQALTTLQAIKEIKDAPDLQPVLIAAKTLDSYKAILRQVVYSQQTIQMTQLDMQAAESAILTAENQLHETLVSAGKCPTCNQTI